MEVKRSNRFDDESEILFPVDGSGPYGDYAHFDTRIMAATDWALQRNPDFYPVIPDTTLHLIYLPDFGGFPALNIWYSYDPGTGVLVYESIEIDQSAYEVGPVLDDEG